MSNCLTGRVFGASLKPAWSEEQINEFLNKTKGDIMVYLINHDKDFNEQGEIAETHTHIYLEYTNPRKITTVANLLEVETNFIEVIRNKKGYLRYLTHMDEQDKYIYDASEVYTNHNQSYEMLVRGNSITDKEIAEYLKQGRGMELLGLVSASRLRTIQSFIHFDNSNLVLDEIRHLNSKMDTIVEIADNVERLANDAMEKIQNGILSMSESFEVIANEMIKVRKLALRGGRK
jgi:hypothetical protein